MHGDFSSLLTSLLSPKQESSKNAKDGKWNFICPQALGQMILTQDLRRNIIYVARGHRHTFSSTNTLQLLFQIVLNPVLRCSPGLLIQDLPL